MSHLTTYMIAAAALGKSYFESFGDASNGEAFQLWGNLAATPQALPMSCPGQTGKKGTWQRGRILAINSNALQNWGTRDATINRSVQTAIKRSI